MTLHIDYLFMVHLYRCCTAQAWAGARTEAPSTLGTPTEPSGYSRSKQGSPDTPRSLAGRRGCNARQVFDCSEAHCLPGTFSLSYYFTFCLGDLLMSTLWVLWKGTCFAPRICFDCCFQYTAHYLAAQPSWSYVFASYWLPFALPSWIIDCC